MLGTMGAVTISEMSSLTKMKPKDPTDPGKGEEDCTVTELAIYKAQGLARQHLMQYCQGEAYSAIEGLSTAKEMIDRLESLYAPADLGNDLTTLEQGYQDCQYVPGEDPTLFILRLQKHNNRLGKIDPKYKKDDDVIKCHILARLPAKFRNVETKLRSALTKMTVEEVSAEVQSEFKALVKHGILKKDGLVLSTK